MDVLGWIIVIALFIIGMAGAIYPILPGVIAIYLALFVYGWFFTFAHYDAWFWTIQTIILVVLFIADYAVNAWGVKKLGGSKASIWGSTIGLIIGPFVIPAFGLIIGPFIGAFIGELLAGSGAGKSMKVGLGSVLGLFSSIVVKVVLQLAMIIVFIVWVF
ncbi:MULTISPECIES: DUF456 domain-containing protein [Paenibacillus]|jgi:uncharacterized protein YqgC (DUF456 family)|uniref:DUF456 family protein n=3 Tax=Paenibacillus TaxID=44249 RepID=G4HLF4_9BACL|nr:MULTISPECIES: DUF456 family protein [Paenibacillus]ANY74448.1 hypothetical protein BBD41_18795 [Paenibacillus ihbetae]EHB56880.1 protein of unknown function DUF456 [Paenibacillus lactis 154]MBP1892601.1 uncharacterized protein YqgC (DUF456 family) [Paenibacillus lactis]MCM3493344.1 DUF456 family protein [Paenibacillus lactis]OOC63371.1 hypothetical protein BBD40_16770 [Paenibacillus ihbetae]